MSSLFLGRAVRQTCATTSISSASRGSTASLAAVSSRPLCRTSRQHQRRHSSSKASVPPNGPRRSAPQQSPSTGGRVSRKKTKASPAAPIDTQSQSFSKHFPNLPSVPPTSHLKPAEINVSSFFSCHRPISVTAAVPLPVTEASFNTIFEPRVQNNKARHQEVIFTLGSVVDGLEAAADGTQDDGSPEWAESENGVKHLDSVPQDIPLEKLVEQYQPFHAPPVPQPFEETQKAAQKRTKKARRAAVIAADETPAPQKKSWSTTIIVTERTWPGGQKTYQATTSDIVRVPDPSDSDSSHSTTLIAEDTALPSHAPIRQPFLRRVSMIRRREQERRSRIVERGVGRPSMLLISVKRQRKLKMKKKKYKKLMRRTRNLRRKLGKI